MTSVPPCFLAFPLRYENSDATQTRYAFTLNDVPVIRVYIEHATRAISISRGAETEPSHVLPIEAVMTEEPDTSGRGDRTGLRVKGTNLAQQLIPAFQMMLVALAMGTTMGQMLSLQDLPVLTDDVLNKLLEG